MMDRMPNRLVYRRKFSCSPYTSYGNASLASMSCFSRMITCLKHGALL